MEKAFSVQLVSYAPLLKNERMSYREDEKCLSVGFREIKSGWVLFISCKTLDTVNILKKILALLKKSGSSFRLIKNQILQYRLNSGAFGEGEVGKVITIFPPSAELAVQMANELCSITETYQGPVIPDALRLGSLVYTQLATVQPGNSPGEIKLSLPDKKNVPFSVPIQFRVKNKRKTIIGRYYIPVQLLRSSPKGDIFKGINLRKFAFNWCLIKQGKPVALDDHFDRDMKDRLLWQKEVLETISGEIYTPSVLDYFEQDGSSYLILNYAEGEPLGKLVRDILNGITWKELDNRLKCQLLQWYLKAIDIVKKIHEKGFVHRDLTDSNFLVMDDGDICIIDFELAYSIDKHRPSPPFLLGTFGYVAPEQMQHAVPDPKEDIYSLGALLSFLVTGVAPHEFIQENPNVTRAKLHRLTGDQHLTREVMNCLHHERKARPELKMLTESIEVCLNQIN